jgi:purine-binding chemotaxis protein CheW
MEAGEATSTRSTYWRRKFMSAASKSGKYLTFQLAEEDYGIALMQIKEIIGMMPITAVPKTPIYMKGVINLRGQVIPVTDLRLKFDIEEIPYNERTCIIVVEVQGEAAAVQVGVVVDAVSEVLQISEDDIEATPSFGAQVDTEYILGMANMDEGVKILLDIDRVMTASDVALLEQAA